MRALVFLLTVIVAGPAVGQSIVCIDQGGRVEPNVPYDVVFLEQNQMRHVCQREWAAPKEPVFGCANDDGDGHWTIFIEKRLDDATRACVIGHELRHLPPYSHRHEEIARGGIVAGALYRREAHFRVWLEWVAGLPETAAITYN